MLLTRSCRLSLHGFWLVIWLNVLVNPLVHTLQLLDKEAPSKKPNNVKHSGKHAKHATKPNILSKKSVKHSVKHSEKHAKHATKPNILLLMTDAMDGRLVDPENPMSKAIRLPFLIDFLGENGANFVKSYTPHPLCTPSRTSMFSGRSPEDTLINGNSYGFAASPEGVLDDNCVESMGETECNKLAKLQKLYDTIPSAMKRLGYDVYLQGKSSVDAAMSNKKNHAGIFNGRVTKHGKHWGFDEMDFWRRSEICKPSGSPELLAVNDSEKVHKKGLWTDDIVDENRTDTNTNEADWQTLIGCKKFIEKLPTAKHATSPFFLHCSFELPHYPFASNSTWIDQYVREKNIVIPKINNNMDTFHPYDKFMMCSQGTKVKVTREMIFKVRRVYYAMVAKVSIFMGEIWDDLNKKGYSLDNTYVVYVSDHGELAGDHHSLYKQSFYDASSRVPLQIAGPGIKKKLRVDTHLTSLLDVFPTLLDMAGEKDWGKHKRKGQLRGKSLLKLASGSSHAPESYTLSDITDQRNCVISQFNWHTAPTAAFMVRVGNWKYIRFGYSLTGGENYPSLLFNMEKDPDELSDVSDQHPRIVERLEAQLHLRIDPGVKSHVMDARNFGKALHHFGSVEAMKLSGHKKFVGHEREIDRFVDKAHENFAAVERDTPRQAGRDWEKHPDALAQWTAPENSFYPLLGLSTDCA